MKIRYFLYFLLIAIFAGVLVYANFFMKEEYIFEDEKIFETQKEEPVEEKKSLGEGVKPDFFPKVIPWQILETSREYDFYSYLFQYPNKKIVLYTYTKGSTDPADSEIFHKTIYDLLEGELNMANYKLITTSPQGAKIYEHGLLAPYEEANYEPNNIDPQHVQDFLLKKRAEIDAVRDFYEGCAKGLCIIYMDKEEYISIDKRDLKKAIKLLKDYQKW